MCEVFLLYVVVGLVIYLTALMEDRVRASENEDILVTMDNGNIALDLFLGAFLLLVYAFLWPVISLCWFVYKVVQTH